MKKTKHFTVRIEPQYIEKMQWLARHDDTTFTWQLRQAIRVYLHNRKKTVYAKALPDNMIPSEG